MKIFIDKSFAKDVDKITDKKLLRNLKKLIIELENSNSLVDLPNVKKIKGYNSFYRIISYTVPLFISNKEAA
ncbi:MAG TPA: plasmid stabilization protein [Ignavibacteriales bacterium]|nr:plasmid stabilization protein [Ignavibacteriales bacterium]